MTECRWPDDDLISDLIYRLGREYANLAAHEMVHGGDDDLVCNLAELDTRLWVDVSELLTLSPPRIWDAFHSFGGTDRETHNTNVAEQVSYLRTSLSDWDGPAAKAFGAHVSNLEQFLAAQQGYVKEISVEYVAAYTLAVQVREDYKALVERWIEASVKYREDDLDEMLGVGLKVGVALLGGVVAVASGGTALALGLAMFSANAAAGVEMYTANLGGDNGLDVWRSFEKEFRRLVDQYREAEDGIRVHVQNAHDRIAGENVPLYEPLPSTTDVDSPDFRYENFYNDSQTSAGYSRKVEVERQKQVSQPKPSGVRTDSPIGLVLDGRQTSNGPVGDV